MRYATNAHVVSSRLVRSTVTYAIYHHHTDPEHFLWKSSWHGTLPASTLGFLLIPTLSFPLTPTISSLLTSSFRFPLTHPTYPYLDNSHVAPLVARAPDQ